MRATTVLEDDLGTGVDEALTDVARAAIRGAFVSCGPRSRRRRALDRVRAYARGKAGIPDVDEGASEELQQIARQSVINIVGVVIDTFDAGLDVVGYRSPTADDDEPAWQLWQDSRMDAHQSEAHRAALMYGEAFVSVLPDDDADGAPRMAVWSPRFAWADFDDPRRDAFPRSAMLTRAVDHPEHGRGYSVLSVDETHVQPGFIPRRKRGKGELRDSEIILDGDPWEHGAKFNGKPVCPVIRFVNKLSADDDDEEGGEVDPLIAKQRAINGANYDRLVTSRFAAFQKTVIIGWSGSKAQVARTGPSRALAFDESPQDISVQQLSASPLQPYNDLLQSMKEEVALEASIPLYTATGSISNVSTDTAAMVEKAHQRKLGRKQRAFGESWELALTVAVVMSGGEQPDAAAEVIWGQTEARSFAQVVDGIVKLASIPEASAGVPVEDLLDLLPGMTQQRIKVIRDGIVRRRASSMTTALAAILSGTSGQGAPLPDAPVT